VTNFVARLLISNPQFWNVNISISFGIFQVCTTWAAIYPIMPEEAKHGLIICFRALKSISSRLRHISLYCQTLSGLVKRIFQEDDYERYRELFESDA
jgi:hypothetical protein